MKFTCSLILFATVFALLGCSPRITLLAALKDGCAQPGQVLDREIEKPKRGYPYRFMVYLPPCYSEQTEASYPIFYFIPGNGGYPGIWFSAGINTIADEMILDKKIPPFILVATDSTEDDFEGSIIHDELIPFVESEYRVIKGRQYRAIAGGSLGGITSYRLGLQHPETFSSVGMFGSGAISGEEKQIKVWLVALPLNQRPRFFMNTGEADPLMLERAEVMDSLLDDYFIPHVLYVGDGGHNYNFWATNLETYFLWVAEEWR
jgi:enterochelin esterase-like enzyme